jgi:hypothetical protein
MSDRLLTRHSRHSPAMHGVSVSAGPSPPSAFPRASIARGWERHLRYGARRHPAQSHDDGCPLAAGRRAARALLPLQASGSVDMPTCLGVGIPTLCEYAIVADAAATFAFALEVTIVDMSTCLQNDRSAGRRACFLDGHHGPLRNAMSVCLHVDGRKARRVDKSTCRRTPCRSARESAARLTAARRPR